MWRWLNLAAVPILVVYVVAISLNPWVNDAYAYWRVWAVGIYTGPYGTALAFTYSPAFAQLIWPLTLLPFVAFWAIWVTMQTVALTAIVRPALAVLLIALPWLPIAGYTNPAEASIQGGNITVLMALVAAFGLRYPALWSLAFLTKLTPGVGVLWFAFRREWRNLAVALGTTAAIAAVSFALNPEAWRGFVNYLVQSLSADPAHMEVLMPLRLDVRLPLAVAILALGAWRNWPWVVPIAVLLGQAEIGLGGFVVIVAVIPYLRPRVAEQLVVQVGLRRGNLDRVDDADPAAQRA